MINEYCVKDGTASSSSFAASTSASSCPGLYSCVARMEEAMHAKGAALVASWWDRRGGEGGGYSTAATSGDNIAGAGGGAGRASSSTAGGGWHG